MKTGLIYKYTNKINQKNYIGQTTSTLQRRDQKHLQQLHDNTYFHRALKKYGRDNFSLVVLEDNIPEDKIDDREKFWIEQFDSYYLHNKGYNMTKGGKWSTPEQKIFGKDIKEIQNQILNSSISFQELADIYQVSLSGISDINTGRTFRDNDLTYPLRPAPIRSELDENKVQKVIRLLTTTNYSQTEIAKQVGIKEYTVGCINRGTNSWCPKNLSYPLVKGEKKNTYSNKLTKEQVIQLLYDLFFSSLTIEQIGQKYGVAKNTVGDISRGLTWKELTKNFIFPLRKNKKNNQEIYSSIYGIV